MPQERDNKVLMIKNCPPMSFNRSEWATLLRAVELYTRTQRAELDVAKRRKRRDDHGEVASLSMDLADCQLMIERLLNYGRDHGWMAQ
jgi:hypothetical protein